MMNGRPYKEMKELPINKPFGDNCTGFQNFCEYVLKVPARVCITHVSPIPANNESFKRQENLEGGGGVEKSCPLKEKDDRG